MIHYAVFIRMDFNDFKHIDTLVYTAVFFYFIYSGERIKTVQM